MKKQIIVYLVRHADALQQEPDETRPLSPKGEETARRVAAWLAACQPEPPQRLLHSGLLRAEQTARILADICHWPAPTAAKNLNPSDDPEPWADRLTRARENIAIVGHMPFLAGLASTLLASDPETVSLAFKKMSVAAFERDETGWSLRWLIRPALLPNSVTM